MLAARAVEDVLVDVRLAACSFWSTSLVRFEADARVGAVAERLRVAAAAAAESCLHDTRDDAAGATGDLEIAAHLQRTVRSADRWRAGHRARRSMSALPVAGSPDAENATS